MSWPLATTPYHDPVFQRPGVKLMPGELYATDEDRVMATVLGSCVAVCLYDQDAGVGGMNHYMLPGGTLDPTQPAGSMRYGQPAMDALIDQVLRLGARRDRLQAKAFGGAAVIVGMTNINVGARNVAFLHAYLAREGIPLVAADLDGDRARSVVFHPRSGAVRLRRLPRTGPSASQALNDRG